MRPKPLFEIGEEVIVLWQDVGPQNDTITNRRYFKSMHIITTGRSLDNSWGYQVAEMNEPHGFIPEYRIRKKPKGIGKTESEFMTDIKKFAQDKLKEKVTAQ